MDRETKIKTLAAELGREDVGNGLRPHHLESSWDMSAGDVDALEGQFGELSDREWRSARFAFENAALALLRRLGLD